MTLLDTSKPCSLHGTQSWCQRTIKSELALSPSQAQPTTSQPTVPDMRELEQSFLLMMGQGQTPVVEGDSPDTEDNVKDDTIHEIQPKQWRVRSGMMEIRCSDGSYSYRYDTNLINDFVTCAYEWNSSAFLNTSHIPQHAWCDWSPSVAGTANQAAAASSTPCRMHQLYAANRNRFFQPDALPTPQVQAHFNALPSARPWRHLKEGPDASELVKETAIAVHRKGWDQATEAEREMLSAELHRIWEYIEADATYIISAKQFLVWSLEAFRPRTVQEPNPQRQRLALEATDRYHACAHW